MRNRPAGLGFYLLLLVHSGGAAQEKFVQAIDVRQFSFPRDHGRHDDFQTEWWYVTGNVRTAQGREFGYQVTFFRRALSPEVIARKSAWAFRDIYASHVAISDIAHNRFFYDQSSSRGALGIAGAADDSLAVHLRSWSMRTVDGEIQLRASTDFGAIDLTLKDDLPPALHGKWGLANKGAHAGQASYYYSLPRLQTRGTLSIAEEHFAVAGVSWMDHEFGSNQLAPEDAGWDWFALHLPDSVEVMLYLLRRHDGSFAPYSAGTVMHRGRVVRHLAFDEFLCTPEKWWVSTRSGARYPIEWDITFDDYQLRVSAAFGNQELDTRRTTGVVYWEGVVKIEGERRGRKIGGVGYLEMTGYVPRAAPVF